MPTSAARIEANQKNALLSTGPRTPEGKARSRANALKEGFTALELRTPEDQAAAAKVADSGWMAEEVAILIDRLRRLHEAEDRELVRVKFRASKSWYDDRMREVEVLARDLAKRPAEIVAELMKTPQGCDWMINRWARLARIADLEKGWDEPARALAFDLLGIPPELRKGNPGEKIGLDGRLADDGSNSVEVARAQVNRLTEVACRIGPLDDFDRETARQGLHRQDSPADRRVRSYEQTLHRRLKNYLKPIPQDFGGPPEFSPPAPVVAPKIEAKPEPVPAEIEAKVDPAPSPVENEPKHNWWKAPEVAEFDLGGPSRPDFRLLKAEKRRAAADRKLARRLDSESRTVAPAGC